MGLRSPKSIEIYGRSLESLLDEHAEWLADGPISADSRSPITLAGADLSDADLTGRDLRGCDLAGADLRGADLSGVDFRDAILTSANFGRSAEIRASTGATRFGGADLAVAALPTVELEEHETGARRAATMFRVWAAGAVCLTLVATVAALLTRDAELFIDSSVIAGVPWSTYYAVAPVLLGVVMWLFLKQGLNPLLLAARELPAVSQEGVELGSRSELWPANLLIAPSMVRLAGEPRDMFFGVNRWAAIIGIWGAIPVVAAAHWWRFLARHVAEITAIHVVVVCAVAAVAVWGVGAVNVTFGSRRQMYSWGGVAFVGILLGAVSIAVFSGWISIGLSIAIEDLRGAGNAISARDFRGMAISYSDLRDVDLADADLREARILFSDLAGSNLGAANLSGASLYGSNLDGAMFDGADLSGADLSCAKLLSTDALENAMVDGSTILPDGKPGPLGDRFGLILPDRGACEAWEPKR